MNTGLRQSEAVDLEWLNEPLPLEVPVIEEYAHNVESRTSEKRAGTLAPICTENEWPDMLPLSDHELPAFPLDAFPKVVGDMGSATSNTTETDHAFSGVLELAVLSTALAGKFEVEVKDGWRESLCIYASAQLESGNTKTAVLEALIAPIRKWEREKVAEARPKVQEAKSKRASEEAVVQGLRQKLRTMADPTIVEEIAKLESELTVIPHLPEIFSTDITPEALVIAMKNKYESFALLSDELGIFSTFTGLYSGMVNIDLLLKAHSGSPVKVHRKSGEPIFLEKPTLTIAITPQPDALRSVFSDPELLARGLPARFLFACPKSKLGYRKLNTPSIPDCIASAYENLITKLLNL